MAPKRPVVSAVTITPGQTQIQQGGQVQFAATVSGSDLTDTSVSWSVSGATSADTKINEEGLLTVGADETAAKLVVTVTSNQDNSQNITADVTVVSSEPVEPPPTDPPQSTDPPAEDDGEEKPVLWIILAMAAVVVAVTAVLVLKKKK